MKRCDCVCIHATILENAKKAMPCASKMSTLADLYKNFADNTRISLLWALQHHEMCVCDLAVLLNMTKSAISHQLRILRISNLVKSRRDGKIVYYSLADDHVRNILAQGFEHIEEL